MGSATYRRRGMVEVPGPEAARVSVEARRHGALPPVVLLAGAGARDDGGPDRGRRAGRAARAGRRVAARHRRDARRAAAPSRVAAPSPSRATAGVGRGDAQEEDPRRRRRAPRGEPRRSRGRATAASRVRGMPDRGVSLAEVAARRRPGATRGDRALRSAGADVLRRRARGLGRGGRRYRARHGAQPTSSWRTAAPSSTR